MESIINPWLFYLLDIVDSIKVLVLCITVILGGTFTFLLIIYSIAGVEFGYEDEDVKSMFKPIKRMGEILVPLLIASILFPSSNTVIKMLVADNVTPNNLEIIGDTIEEGVDYIFEKINLVVEETRN